MDKKEIIKKIADYEKYKIKQIQNEKNEHQGTKYFKEKFLNEIVSELVKELIK